MSDRSLSGGLDARSLVARSGSFQFSDAATPSERHNAAHFAANARACCPVVATEQNLFSVICHLADIGSDDVFLDIGCGDGRLLAHAARTCRCRCIGLDVRQSCLEDTCLVAQQSNVGHLVEVMDQDFMDLCGLEEKLKGATVVYAYLLPHLVKAIEPVLLQAVDDGKKVVLFCSSGSRVRRADAPRAGNQLGELIAKRQAWFGRVRLYSSLDAPPDESMPPAVPTFGAAMHAHYTSRRPAALLKTAPALPRLGTIAPPAATLLAAALPPSVSTPGLALAVGGPYPRLPLGLPRVGSKSRLLPPAALPALGVEPTTPMLQAAALAPRPPGRLLRGLS